MVTVTDPPRAAEPPVSMTAEKGKGPGPLSSARSCAANNAVTLVTPYLLHRAATLNGAGSSPSSLKTLTTPRTSSQIQGREDDHRGPREPDTVQGRGGLPAVRRSGGLDHRCAPRTGVSPRPLGRSARALPITAPSERA